MNEFMDYIKTRDSLSLFFLFQQYFFKKFKKLYIFFKLIFFSLHIILIY